MAKKVEIEVDVTGNVIESTKNLRALKQALKDVPAGTAEWSKIKNQIRDVEDALESANQSSEDFKGLLEAAPGPLGMLGGAIKKVELATKSFGAAWKAIGIGLLVSLVGGLVAAFTKTEGSLKKLEPLLIGMEKIFGGIVEVFQPLLDAFLEMALSALPYITKYIGTFYSSLVALFTLIKEVGVGAGKILKGIFTLDFKSLQAGYEQIKGSWNKTVQSFTDGMARYEEGTKKMTKTEKENAKTREETRQKELEKAMKALDTKNKMTDAELEKAKQVALGLAKTEQEKLDVEVLFAKKSYESKKLQLEEKRKLYDKDSNEYKDYTAQLIQLESQYIATSNSLSEKQNQLIQNRLKESFDKLNTQYTAGYEQRERDRNSADEKELQQLDIKLKSGEIKEYEYNIKLYELKKRQIADRKKLLNQEEQDEKDYFEALRNEGLIGQEDYEKKLLEIQKRYGDKRFENLKQQGENEYNSAVTLAKMLVDTKQYEKDAIVALEQAKVQAIATLGNILSQLAGENKTIAILGLLVSQGAAIADILVKYFRTKAELTAAGAVYKAMIPNPLTAAIGIAGQAAVSTSQAANTIGMASGIAGVAASIAKGIADINGKGKEAKQVNASQNLGRNYGEGGMIEGPRHAQGGVMINAEGGEAILTRGAVTMFRPLLSMMNQMGGGTSFNTGAVGRPYPDAPNLSQPEQTPMILKTYVVSNELTTEAEKQAKLKDLSTL